ncbi:redox-sensing transcriptional repressor [Acetanaerobacterium elongatum]|uniref:Redox-sensing transcriptional repressor n=1 Tax=Acetanaerobacterium elongatum TaxID=258515 RepID=A0A1H0C114_9FIRM|nr:redox-sensing transcriptional repressor [Acetanaerobacterium elongatum]
MAVQEIAQALLIDPQIIRMDMKQLLCKDRISKEAPAALLAAISKLTINRKVTGVVLVGAGRLGSALMSYAGFSAYDLSILAGFDIDPKVIKKGAYGKPVYHISEMETVCRRLDVKTAIITTPGACAQQSCDLLVQCGITAIWNFTSKTLKAPAHVMIRNENMPEILRMLSDHIK